MNSDKRRTPDHADQPPNKPTQAPQTAPEEDQFDPQEYVRQLIVRMGGQPTQTPIPAPSVAPPPAPSAPPTATALPRSEGPRGRASRATEFGDSASTADSNVPRRAANANVDIEKLREAVNISTSSHIQGSQYRIVNKETHIYLLFSVLGIFLCMTFLTLSRSALSISHLASIGCLILGGWSTRRFIESTATLSQLRNREIESPVESVPAA